ncbi:phosphoserine phosphatase SerB [Acinetobacter baumannii 532279]|uniref:phosphoserine phosphatase SerB n=1 Tax=Acinetobacter baumannii TaxID=470 RepID=UPI00045134C2|nr:phosphoserine phosphatase SerB [Acinetobacter baumannii]EXE88949.1 phosphoserine phosphatase SerB [Acinetobacter baumannii 532279]
MMNEPQNLILQSSQPISTVQINVVLATFPIIKKYEVINSCTIKFTSTFYFNRTQRKAIQKFCSENNFDFSFVKNDVYLSEFKLAIFDMDLTLINIECIDEIAETIGKKYEMSQLTELAMKDINVDYDESLKFRVNLLKGINSSIFEEIFNTKVKYTPGSIELIKELKKAGLKIALVSGGFTYFANRVANELDIDFVTSNKLEESDSILTGKIIPPIINVDTKEKTLLELCKKLDILPRQCIAIGDGANDLKMLKKSGLSVGYNPKNALLPYLNVMIKNLHLDSLLNIFSHHK